MNMPRRRLQVAAIQSFFAILQIFICRDAAAAGIAGSKHDLTWDLSRGSALMRQEINNYGEICVYCHTPHHANTTYTTTIARAPLWNRSTSLATYTMYDSGTIDTSIPGTPNGRSLACLSCHDGTIAVDSIVNAPGAGFNTGGPWYGRSAAAVHFAMAAGAGACGECHVGGAIHNQAYAWIGSDLSNDHPISMSYPTAAEDPAFNTPPDSDSGWTDIKLFDGHVECPSCHNPHTPDIRPFLRKSNEQSEVCLTCHVK